MTPEEAARILDVSITADREAVRRAFVLATRKTRRPEDVKKAIVARRVLELANRPS